MRRLVLPSSARAVPATGLRAVAIGTCLLVASAAQAMSFGEAFAAARNHDAQYRAAAFELDAARLGVPIARAGQLPTVGLNVSNSSLSGTREFPNSLGQDVKVGVDYSTPQATLQLRMPIINFEGAHRYSQAQAQSDAAEAVYRSRGLELLDRLGNAYLQVLLAEDNRGLAEGQAASMQGQLARSEQRLKRGEGTRTELAVAQAALDIAGVRVFEAIDQVEIARHNLTRLVGSDPLPLRQLAADFSPAEISPGRLADWLALAIRQNPAIEARQQSLVATQMGVKRQSAGHLPRLDLVASLARSQNDSISNLNQTSVLKSVGVQFNLPIYSGGSVDAGIKQALAEQSRAEQEIRNEREAVEIEVHKQYQAVTNGAAKIDAYRRALDSSGVALQGATRALEAGLGTVAEVLDAQSRQYIARRDLAQARYDYLQARLRLMTQAGMPVDEVAADVDRLLSVPSSPAQGARS